jgi:hypothetical protein
MPAQHGTRRSGGGVPADNTLVETAGYDGLTIWRDGNRAHGTAVAPQVLRFRKAGKCDQRGSRQAGFHWQANERPASTLHWRIMFRENRKATFRNDA